MRLNRFFVGENLKLGKVRIQDSELANQIRSVLRLKIGELVILCDGHLGEAESRIVEYSRDFVEFNIMNIERNESEYPRNVILYCAILKRENFELVVQKAVELGIKEIVPILTKRTVKLNLRYDRFEKIIKEAAEQSGRGLLPQIHEIMNLEEAFQQARGNEMNILFDISGNPIRDSIRQLANYNSTGLFIGPEGGWDSSEIQMAKESKFQIFNLGKLTLRAETAAIVACALITNH